MDMEKVPIREIPGMSFRTRAQATEGLLFLLIYLRDNSGAHRK